MDPNNKSCDYWPPFLGSSYLSSWLENRLALLFSDLAWAAEWTAPSTALKRVGLNPACRWLDAWHPATKVSTKGPRRSYTPETGQEWSHVGQLLDTLLFHLRISESIGSPMKITWHYFFMRRIIEVSCVLKVWDVHHVVGPIEMSMSARCYLHIWQPCQPIATYCVWSWNRWANTCMKLRPSNKATDHRSSIDPGVLEHCNMTRRTFLLSSFLFCYCKKDEVLTLPCKNHVPTNLLHHEQDFEHLQLSIGHSSQNIIKSIERSCHCTSASITNV